MLSAYHNYVVVKVDEAHIVEHDGGFVIAASDIPCTGVVTSVGPSCRAPELAQGVKVLIPPAPRGAEYREGKDIYIIFLDHEIYGVIND